jgi:hypothetical protein
MTTAEVGDAKPSAEPPSRQGGQSSLGGVSSMPPKGFFPPLTFDELEADYQSMLCERALSTSRSRREGPESGRTKGPTWNRLIVFFWFRSLLMFCRFSLVHSSFRSEEAKVGREELGTDCEAQEECERSTTAVDMVHESSGKTGHFLLSVRHQY